MIAERFITPHEYATRYGFQYTTVLLWARQGRIPFKKIGQRRIYVLDPGHLDNVGAAPRELRDVDKVPVLRGVEVAQLLGVSTRRVRQMVERGQLNCRMFSRRRRYSVDDLRKIIAYREARLALPNGDNSEIHCRAKEVRESIKRWAMQRLAAGESKE